MCLLHNVTYIFLDVILKVVEDNLNKFQGHVKVSVTVLNNNVPPFADIILSLSIQTKI